MQTSDLSAAAVNIIVLMRWRMWRTCANVRLFHSLSTAHSPDTRVSHSLHSAMSLSNWSHCFCHPCFPHCTGAPHGGLLLHSEVLPRCFQVSCSLKGECTLWLQQLIKKNQVTAFFFSFLIIWYTQMYATRKGLTNQVKSLISIVLYTVQTVSKQPLRDKQVKQ